MGVTRIPKGRSRHSFFTRYTHAQDLKTTGKRRRITSAYGLGRFLEVIMNAFSSLAKPCDNSQTFKTELTRGIMKKKIYVAEDDLNILFALETMLEDAGYDVLPFHCGAPMLQENLPAADLFIVDKLMPDVDGLDVCRHLKSRADTKDVPLIMISALRNFKRQALREGVDDFLEKPFKMDSLLKLVAKHTQKNTNPAFT